VSGIKRFEDLKVWQKSPKLVLVVYKVTQQFPIGSVVSAAANNAEGSKREHLKEYIQMLSISHGSLSETEYYLLLAKDLNYLNDTKYQELFNLSEEIGRTEGGVKV